MDKVPRRADHFDQSRRRGKPQSKMCIRDRPELEDLLLGIAQAAVSPAVNRDLSSRDAVPILSQSQRRILGWLLIEIKQHELEEKRRRLEEDAAKLQALNGASMEEDVPF